MAMLAILGYKLVEVLGEGPRATVYKAEDPKSQSWVAVKLFHTLEIENAGKLLLLKHPHIATFFDLGRTSSQAFAVAEYLSGGTLKEHIRSMSSVGDVFPPDQILAYAEQIADALTYAHDQGISHGNVKAENVMFSEDCTLKLTDFSSQSSMSSDLEAFGKVLYEMATGRLPFPGATVPPIETFRNDLPAAFTQIVTRLIDHERKDCYKDSRNVLADLRSSSPTQMMTLIRTIVPAGGTSSIPAAPGFSEGRLLAGRFRIERFIARGGMGDVFEAEDLELHERVALKTVRPEIAGSAHAMERFKREIQLARKVTHPNVCRIFDLFRDTEGAENITFLTMELLNGGTLGQRLGKGRMSEGEA